MSNVTKRRRRSNVTSRGHRGPGNVTSSIGKGTLPSPGAEKQKRFRDNRKNYLALLASLEAAVRDREPKKFKALLSKIDDFRLQVQRSRYGSYF